jgi:hypothetical protein
MLQLGEFVKEEDPARLKELEMAQVQNFDVFSQAATPANKY